MPEPPHPFGIFRWSGYLLGFGLGGFFDGILLHQILQWHHLLSLVEGVEDIRSQILFDGLFHALMYLLVAAGLAMLTRSRIVLAEAGAGRLLLANALIGFGFWHVLDNVLSHWVLGIHRIKLDSPNPLLWDLIWFAAFGLVPIALGLLARRRGPGAGGPNRDGRAAALGIVLAVVVAGPWAARSSVDSGSAIVLFRPGMTDGEVMNAVAEAGGFVLWRSRGLWAVRWSEGGRASRLYGRGAMIVGGAFPGAGCLAWTRA